MNPADRSQQLSAFYATTAQRVRGIVRHQVIAQPATVEDACQIAWTILSRRSDVTLDEHGVRWLATVAIHAVYKLTSLPEIPMGTLSGDDLDNDELPELEDPTPGPSERAEAQELRHARREDLRALKPAERLSLYLHGLGHSYKEIAALTDSTYTAVNRRITEGRAHLRRLERERTASDSDER